jgi:Zn-finger nucleic acid-binding protein
LRGGRKRQAPQDRELAVCPVCGAELAVKYFASIEIQWCAACGGFWVQRGRFGDVLKRYMSHMAQQHDAKCGRRKRVNPRTLEEPGRTCPLCGRAMSKLNYAYNSNVIVDLCGNCNGLWVDRGEVEKIAWFFKHCGLPKDLRQQFEDIKTIYDHHERKEALEMLADGIVWILSGLI